MGLVLLLMCWNNISPILAPWDAEMLVDAPLEFYSQILEGNPGSDKAHTVVSHGLLSSQYPDMSLKA